MNAAAPPPSPPAPPGPPSGPPPGSGHLSDRLLAAFASRTEDPAAAAAAEVHLAGCAVCRARLGGRVAEEQPDRLAASWLAVEAELTVPRRRWLERALVRVGVPADTVRLMAATPSLRRSWYLAVTAALLFGVIAAGPDRPAPSAWLFLALAPLVPVVGVALAYGRGVDPAYEVTVAAPVSGLRLVLVRSLAVLAASIACVGAAALLIPKAEAVVLAAWLVPALALSAVCLALSTFVPPRLAAWLTSAGWLVGVTLATGTVTSDRLAGFGAGTQLVVAVLGLVAVVVLVARRRRFDLVAA